MLVMLYSMIEEDQGFLIHHSTWSKLTTKHPNISHNTPSLLLITYTLPVSDCSKFPSTVNTLFKLFQFLCLRLLSSSFPVRVRMKWWYDLKMLVLWFCAYVIIIVEYDWRIEEDQGWLSNAPLNTNWENCDIEI